MKTIKILLTFSLICALFTACQQEDTAEEVMMKFANHFAAGEYDEAAVYGTASTKQLLEMMKDLASVGFYLPDEEEIVKYTLADINCTVSGSTALCSYIEYGETAEVSLVKVDGKWLVDIPLDDLYEEGDWFEDEEDEWFSESPDSLIN